jgi:hypothetical protein
MEGGRVQSTSSTFNLHSIFFDRRITSATVTAKIFNLSITSTDNYKEENIIASITGLRPLNL